MRQKDEAMNSPFRLEVVKTIHVPVWDEQARQRVTTFWQGRGVAFSEVTTGRLRGHRGSLWGNLTSYDMGKFLANLTISQVGPTELLCQLDVDTRGQDITEWNRAYWGLEMDTLESFLLHGDQKEEEWEQFLKESKAAAWQWSLSFRRLGRKMPRKP